MNDHNESIMANMPTLQDIEMGDLRCHVAELQEENADLRARLKSAEDERDFFKRGVVTNCNACLYRKKNGKKSCEGCPTNEYLTRAIAEAKS